MLILFFSTDLPSLKHLILKKGSLQGTYSVAVEGMHGMVVSFAALSLKEFVFAAKSSDTHYVVQNDKLLYANMLVIRSEMWRCRVSRRQLRPAMLPAYEYQLPAPNVVQSGLTERLMD